MKLQKIIVLLGPPGSGKGTQSKLLVEKFGFAYFSMGDTLRQFAKRDNDLGRAIKNLIDQGMIVTQDLTEQVTEASWGESLDKPGIIMEGYPRTEGQIEVLERFMTANSIVDLKVIYIEVEKEKLLKRLSTRKTCPNCQAGYGPNDPEYQTEVCKNCGTKLEARVDDSDQEAIEKRFAQYTGVDAPVARVREFYQTKGLLVTINGDQSVEQVHADIISKLGNE